MVHRSIIRFFLLSGFLSVSLLAVSFIGCSDGSGEDTTAPTVTISSHEDGETITGNRTITLTGTLDDEGTIAAVVVDINGVEVTAEFDQESFTAEVELGNNQNTLVVVATDDADNEGSSTELSLDYPFVELTTFQASAYVIGQGNFSDSDINRGDGDGNPGAGTLHWPRGSVGVHDDHIYIADSGNRRVLVFNSFPTVNGADATYVLGQVDFTTDTSGPGLAEMSGPRMTSIFDGALFMADASNNRGLLWNSAPVASTVAADIVIGETQAGDCLKNQMKNPVSVRAADNKLLVADSSNHRVMIWNEVPTTDSENADLVLGQSSLTECLIPLLGPTAQYLNNPVDVWSDGERVYVADKNHNRVLVWTDFPSSNQEAADMVVGQAKLDEELEGTTRQGLYFPVGVFSNGNQLFVADSGNHRVMIWNEIPTVNGTPADVVLGQGDFTHGDPNDDDQDGAQDATPSRRTFNQPDGVAAYENRLIVTDLLNHRVLIFEGL